MIISVKNNKGGVGKTFLTIQIGHALSLLEKKVLILTSDSQNNILDYTYEDRKKPIYYKNILDGEPNPIFKTELKEAVKLTNIEFKEETLKLRNNLEYMPLCDTHFSRTFLEQLKTKLVELKEEYDYILIDSIPTLETDIVFSELADKIIIPLYLDRVTVEAFFNVAQLYSDKILSVVINKYRKTNLEKKYLKAILDVYGKNDIVRIIPLTSSIETLLDKGKTIFDGKSKNLDPVKNQILDIAEIILQTAD